MKNNIITNLKNGIKNTNYNFAKNLFYHLICPAVIALVGLIMVLCINFNLGMDFKGGTVATVVIEQDLGDGEVYKNTKAELDKVLKNNKINGLVYQKVETDYYGNAISVKFEGISDELRETLRADLVSAFHADDTEADKEIFVKVDNFAGSVDMGIVLSTALAMLIAVICAMVYIWIRFGVSAGFITMFMALFDNAVLLFVLAITRVRMEIGTMAGFGFVTIYSLISSLVYFIKINENEKQEKYSKLSNTEMANIAVKDVIVSRTIFVCILFVFALLLDVVPVYMVSSSSLPMLISAVIVYLSSLYITPGIWSRTYLKRKVKAKQEKEKEVVVEQKLAEEDITQVPEVIVETEAKE